MRVHRRSLKCWRVQLGAGALLQRHPNGETCDVQDQPQATGTNTLDSIVAHLPPVSTVRFGAVASNVDRGQTKRFTD